MKRTLGSFVLLGVILAPTSQVFAMSQTDLYSSYALAYADVALTSDTAVGVDVSDMGVDGTVDASTTVETDSSADINSDATMEEGSTFRFNRSDMVQGSVSVPSLTNISTRSDLEAYASAAMQEDANMERADFSNTAVSVWYKHPAKLFGVVPMDMTVEATADASGAVTVTYPWYSFLLSATDKAEVQSAIEERLSVNISAENSSTFSTRTQAEVLADIRAALAASAN